MLMVLEIGKRRRRGLREYLRSALRPPRRLEVWEVVRETGRYGILTAYPDKKGELPWEDVRQAAGKEARHLLCPAGCTLPEEEGLLPFRPSGQMQGQLMQQAALFLLRRASAASLWVYTIPTESAPIWRCRCSLTRRRCR